MTLESALGEYLRFPTPAEVLAIERAARRAQAKAIARLLAAAGRQLKKMIAGGATVPASKVRRTEAATQTVLQLMHRPQAVDAGGSNDLDHPAMPVSGANAAASGGVANLVNSK